MNIVLHEPEIPQNTGNIARTCVATSTTLHLIKPLGFSIDDKAVKRAGMDYWDKLDLRVYENYEEFYYKNKNAKIWFGTTKAHHIYTEVSYSEDDFIIFGAESKGIPEEILVNNEETCIRIPMIEGCRSLNLANSTCIVLYEALRQQKFANLEAHGELHRLNWN
ncbi:MAG: tRNA (uridine(34)/cytosine(34)/5-carboxymethylaminomethyluridine(34)-2'-O)-methyltransferase TrmL [bacterium]